MALALPTSPLPKQASPRPIVFGGWLTPTGGGEEQFLQRLGSRWALDVVTPNLLPEPDGRLWTSVLTRAWFNGDTVVYPWPQPGFVTTGSGTPVADGTQPSGNGIAVRGLTPGYRLRVGQAFSHISAGRRRLYISTVNNAAGSDGKMGLYFAPMLRVPIVNGDTLEFDVPMIEGKAAGNARSWTMIPARTQSLSFAIEEIA